MTRGQRAVHAIVWPALALVLAVIIGGALYERARVDAAARADVEAG